MKQSLRYVLFCLLFVIGFDGVGERRVYPIAVLAAVSPAVLHNVALIGGALALVGSKYCASRWLCSVADDVRGSGVAVPVVQGPGRSQAVSAEERERVVQQCAPAVQEYVHTVREHEERVLIGRFITADARRVQSVSPGGVCEPAYRTVQTAHGMRFESDAGVYCSLEQRPVHPAQVRYEHYLASGAVVNSMRAQVDGAYVRDLTNQVDGVFRHLAAMCSSDLIEAILARLSLPDMGLPEPWGGILAQAVESLYYDFFASNGALKRPVNSNAMPRAARRFARRILKEKSVRDICSRPEFFCSDESESSFAGVKRLFSHSWNMHRAVRESVENKQIREIIRLCSSDQFNKASHIHVVVDGFNFTQAIIDYYLDHKRAAVYNDDGILRTVEDDPVYRRLDAQTKEALRGDPGAQDELNTLLAYRHRLRNLLYSRWELPTGNSQVQAAVYALLDHGSVLADQGALVDRAVEVAQTPAVIKAFFLPNGVLKDLADCPGAREEPVWREVNAPESAELRRYINHKLLHKTVYGTEYPGKAPRTHPDYILRKLQRGASVVLMSDKMRPSNRPGARSPSMTPGTDPDDDEGEYDGDEEQLKREQAEDAQKEKGMGCMSQKIKTLYRTTKCFYRYLHNIFNRKLSDAKNIRVVDKYWELLRDRAKAAEKNIDIDRSDLFKNGIPYKHLFEGKPNARGGISGYHIRAVFPQVIQEKVKSGSVVQASSWRVRIYDAVSKRFVFDTKSIFDISPRQLQDLFFDIIKDCNINDIQFKKQIITTISRVEGQQYILRIGYDGSMISLFPLIGA